MKDYLRNPNLYFLAVPLLTVCWALYAYAIQVPSANKTWEEQEKDYTISKKYITNILELAPERLEYKKSDDKADEFDYARVIATYAKQHGIPSKNYKVISRKPVKKSGKRTQSADITIETIDIQKLASFLSRMLGRWPGLECEQLSLAKLRQGKDNWKVTLKLTYRY